jgi:hypothetical protein
MFPLISQLYGLVILAQVNLAQATDNCELVRRSKPIVDRLAGNIINLGDLLPITATATAVLFGLLVFIPKARTMLGGALKYILGAFGILLFLPIVVDMLYQPKCL